MGWLTKKDKSPPSGPDFSGVDSQAKAEELARRGDLHKLYMMPLELGGEEVTANMVYVPAFVVELKRNIDLNIVLPLVEQQKVKRYSAQAQYEGKSFVPCAIQIVASDPSDFETVINIWGEALKEK